MIFTLYYMYATFIQWWRLGSLRNKLSGTVNSHNALLVCSETIVYDTKKSRSFENLLFRNEERIGCTVVPRQKVNLSQWVVFPKDYKYFPIFFKTVSPKLTPPHVYILIQAMLETYVKHSADLIEIEHFGELVAWRVADYFEAVLKTDMDKLTKLIHCYSQGNIDINHELKLLKIETIDIEGIPSRIKYDRKFSTDFIQKYSHSPVHWKKFTESVKELYSRIRDSNNPKITIENGKSDEIRKVPVSEVKPIKKDRRHEDRHTLDVASEERRRHKTIDHKKEKTSPSRSEVKTREETPRRREDERRRTSRTEESSRDRHHRKEDRSKQRREEDEKDRDMHAKEEEKPGHRKDVDKETHHRKEDSRSRSRHHDRDRERDRSRKSEAGDEAETSNQTQKDSKRQPSRDRVKPSRSREGAECLKSKRESSKVRLEEKSKSKERESSSLVDSSKSSRKDTKSKESSLKQETKSETKLQKEKSKSDSHQKLERTPAKRSGSGDKKLVKRSLAVDDTEHELKTIEAVKDGVDSIAFGGGAANTNGHLKTNDNAMMVRSSSVKPPNILVYADSLIAKDNVKIALTSMLNREKYTIYDLPIDSKQMIWDQSTVLVVVCGAVPPNLTFNLLQYLLQGGQLLCLCSDLLYSVLHTFTTAEVREHELVCFNYGRWQQVKMMHHIFCYQASPAKKQFSKDSDQSNQSSRGSSPIAPRTPSIVELQHNGKDYTMQVQVLGTEETWQTPSLLLATVKGGQGRAIFSQVHLEINPNQFEDDENKFEALKHSDQARLEILKDILASHLDIDCSSSEEPEYTPGYFLGRHEMKMKLLTEGSSIKSSVLETENITVKFCGTNESPEAASKNFLPVFIHSCPSNFSTVNYFEALETEHIGRLVIYTDVMSSSQAIISKNLAHGLVVIPRRQVSSVGRSNNTWISPEGSASFSLQMHVDLDSPLGKTLPLMQHLVMVAIVSAVKTVRECEDLNIGIKWPNDLYANGHIKIGGLMVQSSVVDKYSIVNIGCGVNLNNSNPTICINGLISVTNETKGSDMKTIPYEAYFASVFNEIERIYNKVQSGDMDYLFDLYYKYWLHNNCDITVTTKSGDSEYVKIVGIDDYGYLRVRSQNGSINTVQPDGNTFDMLRGLICPKPF